MNLNPSSWIEYARHRLGARLMSKFDRPAAVSWSVAGPGGMPMPSTTRDFATLREALLFIRTLPHGSRSKMTIHAGGRRYGPADLERLEKEMRSRR